MRNHVSNKYLIDPSNNIWVCWTSFTSESWVSWYLLISDNCSSWCCINWQMNLWWNNYVSLLLSDISNKISTTCIKLKNKINVEIMFNLTMGVFKENFNYLGMLRKYFIIRHVLTCTWYSTLLASSSLLLALRCSKSLVRLPICWKIMTALSDQLQYITFYLPASPTINLSSTNKVNLLLLWRCLAS